MPQNARADPIIDTVAGVAGALLALSATYPLITLNTKQHTTRTRGESSLEEHRSKHALSSSRTLKSLYRGLYPAMIGTAASQAVYQYWYSRLGTTYRARTRVEPSAGASLAIASVAGCVNVLMTLPIWTIVAKMQADVAKKREAEASTARDADETAEDIALAIAEKRKKGRDLGKAKSVIGFFDIAREVYRESGVGGFWQGLAPSLVMVSNPALQYAFYETSAKWTLKRGHRASGAALTVGEIFVLGALAKFGATMVTYPILVVKSRLQVMSKDMADERMKYRGTAHAITRMAKEEGLGVFYKGLSTKLTQTILAAALMFAAKEKLAEKIYAASFALRTRVIAG